MKVVISLGYGLSPLLCQAINETNDEYLPMGSYLETNLSEIWVNQIKAFWGIIVCKMLAILRPFSGLNGLTISTSHDDEITWDILSGAFYDEVSWDYLIGAFHNEISWDYLSGAFSARTIRDVKLPWGPVISQHWHWGICSPYEKTWFLLTQLIQTQQLWDKSNLLSASKIEI